MGFVEIIDSPDQAALDVSPCTEIFHVKVTDCQNMRSLSEIGADLWPYLCPAIVSGAQKGKDIGLHVGVFEAKVLLDNGRAVGQPIFKVTSCLNDVHTAEDSRGMRGKSMKGTLNAMIGESISAIEIFAS